ncbi:MAG: AI-2E family transporter [Bryobacterales bacterium]
MQQPHFLTTRFGVGPALTCAVVGLLMWLAGDVLMVLFASLLVAVFLDGAAGWIGHRTRLSRRHSLLAVVLLITVSTIAGVWLLAPRVADQVDQLSRDLPQSLDRLTSALQQNAFGRWLLQQGESMGKSGQAEGEALSEVGRGLTAKAASLAGMAVSNGFGALAYLVFAVANGLYLAAELDSYRNGFVRLFSPSKRVRVNEVVGVSIHSLQGWLFGIAVSMTILGVASFIGLSILGVPLALTFALFTAVMTFIPNLGPVMSVIPPVLLGFAESPMTSVYVLVFYIVLQNAEGLVLTPKVQQHAASIPPALLLSVQLLLAALWGFYGLVVAAPLCAVGVVLVQMIYLEDHLGEDVDIPGYRSGTES